MCGITRDRASRNHQTGFCIRANAPSRAASTGLSNGRKRRTAALSLRPCLWTSKVPLLVDLEGAAVGFAKVLRLDLAHCVAGDVAGHEHAFGLLVFCEIACDSGLNLLFIDLRSGALEPQSPRRPHRNRRAVRQSPRIQRRRARPQWPLRPG